MDISTKSLEDANISESSRRTYRKFLAKFFKYIQNLPITTENVKKYIEEKYKDRAKNTRRLVTLTLNTYVLRPLKLEPLKIPNRDFSESTMKNHFSEEQLTKLIEIARRRFHPDLYHCLYIAKYTGLRINEIVSLTCQDIITGCTKSPIEICVKHGKGNKSRIVLVCASDNEYFLHDLLPYALSKQPPTSKIIDTKYDNLRRMLKLSLEMAHIYDHKSIGFHGLRSFFCTDKYGKMISNHVPYPNAVMQQLLGHSNFRTTKRYIRPRVDAMRNYATQL